MVSLVMLASSALSIAARRRGLSLGSPPVRAATVISRIILVKSLPRLASCAPLCLRMLAHLEWPAMGFSCAEFAIFLDVFIARLARAMRELSVMQKMMSLVHDRA